MTTRMKQGDLDQLLKTHNKLVGQQREAAMRVEDHNREVVSRLAEAGMFNCFSINWTTLRRTTVGSI